MRKHDYIFLINCIIFLAVCWYTLSCSNLYCPLIHFGLIWLEVVRAAIYNEVGNFTRALSFDLTIEVVKWYYCRPIFKLNRPNLEEKVARFRSLIQFIWKTRFFQTVTFDTRADLPNEFTKELANGRAFEWNRGLYITESSKDFMLMSLVFVVESIWKQLSRGANVYRNFNTLNEADYRTNN